MSKEAFELTLDAGTYYICSCGQSKNLLTAMVPIRVLYSHSH